jgi:hypothetical protein
MRCRLCFFPHGNLGEMLLIGVCYQITWRPSLFSIDSLDELSTLFDPLFKLQYTAIVWLGKRLLKVTEKRRNLFCLLTEIFWSAAEVILKQYWKVLYNDFEEVSNK